MVADPGETVNLARNPDYNAVLEQHRAFLQDFQQSTGDRFPRAVD